MSGSKMNKFGVFIQARMSSSRFPGKSLQNVNGEPLAHYIYKRCQLSQAKQVVMAVSDDASDVPLFEYFDQRKLSVKRGTLHDVLGRFIKIAKEMKIQHIVRVCADTPLVDIELMNQIMKELVERQMDYVSIRRNECATCFFSEAFTLDALNKAAQLSQEVEDREHVTKFILDHPEHFKMHFVDKDINPDYMQELRLTVDYPQDLDLVKHVIGGLKDKYQFSSQEVMEHVRHSRLQNK